MGTNDKAILPAEQLSKLIESIQANETARNMIENEVITFNHDIRSATGNILRMAYMLKQSISKPTEKQQNYLRLIEGSVKRLANLNEALQANQRLLHLKIRSVKPSTIFRKLKKQYPSSNIEWQIDDSFKVKTDPQKLAVNVLNSLLDNALTYAGTDPKIIVSVKNIGSEAIFCVADNGSGIPEEKRDAVLALGQSSRLQKSIPGTGIGLYQAKETIKAMNGLLWIGDSKDGCEIYFSLPVDMNYVQPTRFQCKQKTNCNS